MFDSAVMIYAFGGEHEFCAPCRELMLAVREGSLAAETTTLALQEVLHQRARRTGDREAAARVVRDLAIVLPAHEFRPSDVERAAELFRVHPGLDAADACHAAIAMDRGVTTIVTADRGFDGITGLQRVSPSDAVARLREDAPPR